MTVLQSPEQRECILMYFRWGFFRSLSQFNLSCLLNNMFVKCYIICERQRLLEYENIVSVTKYLMKKM